MGITPTVALEQTGQAAMLVARRATPRPSHDAPPDAPPLVVDLYRTFRNQDQQVQATFRFRVSDPSQTAGVMSQGSLGSTGNGRRTDDRSQLKNYL